MKKRVSIIVGLLIALLGVLAFGVACKPSEDEPVKQSGNEVGEYYCEVGLEEYLLTLSEQTKFTLAMGSVTRSGEYTLEGQSLSLAFDEGEPATASALLQDDTITLQNYQNTNYRFLKKIEYTVKFDTKGYGVIADATVINGKPAVRPADPARPGYVFVGWYSDGEYESRYDFSQPVRGNLTLYARFEKTLDPEFTVSFNANGGEGQFDPVQTVGGKLFELPTPTKAGDEFVGWWVSQYNAAEKLSFRYEEQQLFENTTLFAVWKSSGPAVSFSEKGVSWSADGLNNSYSFKLVDPDGNVVKESTDGQTSFAYDFTQQPAGEYTATVTLNGKSVTAYYKNKALARVSVFTLDEFILRWNEIANATSYRISYECATEDHKHVDVVCQSASYDFSGCDIPEDGITFTVRATADGFMDSTSAPYGIFAGVLPAVGKIDVDPDSDLVHWEAVEHATSYVVDVALRGQSVEGFPMEIRGTELSLKGLGSGNYTISVTPKARGWNSPEAVSAAYLKERIAVPSGITLINNTVRWSPVVNAVGYEVVFNGVTYPSTTETSFELLDSYKKEGQTSYTLTVRALDSNSARNSLLSDEFVIRTGELGGLTYEQGVLSWDALWGATNYLIKVGSAEEISVTSTSYRPTYTEKGETLLSVHAVLSDGASSNTVSQEVIVYAVYFDVGEGHDTTTVGTLYRAYGDPLSVAELSPSRLGYTFGGWYTAESGGLKYNPDLFEEHSDYTVFAKWTPFKFTVSFVVDPQYGEAVEQYEVSYEQPFSLPVPAIKDGEFGFLGWFSRVNGQGMQYTDYSGKSISDVFTDLKDITLYAHFDEIFIWEALPSGNGYRVSKNPLSISGVREVKIPAMHLGQPVLEISDFSGLSNLLKISIPSCVNVINLAAGSVAFRNCANLREVEVYEVDQAIYPHVPVFSSEDGALYQDSEGVLKLAFFPSGRSGVFTVKKGTQIIPAKAFDHADYITEVVLPASVTKVEKQAFYYCDGLEKVTFLEPEDGEQGASLDFSEQAFSYLEALTTIVLPARLTKFAPSIMQSCKALYNIIIGDDSGAGNEGDYTSIGGLLCKVIKGGKELVYVPAGRTELTIASGIVSIGEAAMGVSSDSAGKSSGTANTTIEKIVIPAYVTNIGRSAFRGSSHLKEIVFEGTESSAPLTIDAYAFYGVGTATGYELTTITLPPNVVKIGEHAFGGASKLKTVRVESSGKLNGGKLDFASGQLSAFGSTPSGTASSLTYYVEELYLGADVPDIDILGIFGAMVAQVEVDPKNNNYETYNGDGVLYNKGVTSIRFYPNNKQGAYTTPESLEEIPANTFNMKSNLTEITIGVNVTSIGDYAFMECSGLTKVTFVEGGNKPLVIGVRAFAGYNAAATRQNQLTSIELPERTTEIGTQAFIYSSKLLTIKLPKSLQKLGIAGGGEIKDEDKDGYSIFEYCTNLQRIEVAEGGEYFTSENGALYTVKDGKPFALMYVPQKWTPDDGSTVFTVPATVQEIWGGALRNNNVVTEVKFETRPMVDGENGKQEPLPISIGPMAFYYCKTLAKIELPRGLKEIRGGTFYYCEALTEIFIPNTVELIAVDITKLSSSLYAYGAFQYCTSLRTVTFEEGNEDTPLELGDPPAESKYYYGVHHEEDHGSISYGDGIFKNCYALTSIVLPERTSKIGRSAFANSNLESITIPSSVEVIGADAFYHCTKLKEVTFTNRQKSKLSLIEEYAFAETAITKLELPDSVEKIYYQAFAKTPLESITLPENLTELCGSFRSGIAAGYSTYVDMSSAFSGCTSLTSVVFNKKLEKIGSSAFAGSIGAIELPATLTYIGNSAFNGAGVTSVVFEDGSQLARLGTGMFANNKTLTKVDFGKTTALKTLGDKGDTIGVFENDSALTAVVIPASVETIGKNVFKGCLALASVTWETDEAGQVKKSSIKTIGSATGTTVNGTFQKTSITRFEVPESDSAITLGLGIFSQCNDLAYIKLSAQVVKLDGAFNGCRALSFIEVDPANENFGSKEGVSVLYAKDGDGSLSSIYLVYGAAEDGFEIPQNAEEIGMGAFKGQSNLTEITIPRTVKKIGAEAFMNCVNLQTVHFESGSQLTEIDYSAFQNCTSLTTFEAEKLINWSTIAAFSTSSSTTGVFANCRSLVSIDLSHTRLKSLQIGMFRSCSSLEDIKFPQGLTSLGTGSSYGYVFQYCTGLQEIDLTETAITEIYNYNFSYCTSLNSVKLPGALTKIGTYVFEYCESLQGISIPSNVSSIGTYAFRASGLRTVQLPSALKEIPSNCFRESALTSVTIPKQITKINTGAFADCSELKKVVFEDDVNANGELNPGAAELTFATGATSTTSTTLSAFHGSPIGEVSFPKRLKGLWNGCFSHSGITKVLDWGGVENIGNYVFYDTALTEVEIPDVTFFSQTSAKLSTNPTASSYMFFVCTQLEKVSFVKGFSGTNFSGNSANHAFDGCTALETVDFTNATKLNYLGGNAFKNCTSLKKVDLTKTQIKYLSGSATSLGTSTSGTFDGCTSLEEVLLPDSIVGIGGNAFNNCEKLVHIGNLDKVTQIYNYAFYNTALGGSLEGTEYPVKLSDKLSSLGTYVFAECKQLKGVEFGNNTTISYLGQHTFENSALETIDLSQLTKLTRFSSSGTANVTLTTASYIFSGCDQLVKVQLPETLTMIGGFAFSGCAKLTESGINLQNVTHIANNAFENSGFVKPSLSADLQLLGNAFIGCDLESLTIGGSACESSNGMYVYDGSIVALGPDAVDDDGVITIPEGCTFGGYLFNGVIAKKIVLPSDLTEIPGYAFWGSEIDEIEIPASVTSLASYAFAGANFKKVVIENTVTSIKASAFRESHIEEVEIKNPEAMGTNSYIFTDSTVKTVTLPEGLTTLGNYMFQNTTELTSITLPESLTTIGMHAFDGSALTTITIPKNVEFIGNTTSSGSYTAANAAFQNSKLKEVVIQSAKISKSYAFSGATELTTVKFDSETPITSLPSSMFNGCTALESITLPSTLNTISASAFSGAGLTSIEIPTSVTTIGASAFNGTKLKSVKIPASVTSNNSSFNNCLELTTVEFEGALAVDLTTMFKGCTNLKTVKLPDEITGFGASCFDGCTSLNIWVPESVVTINATAFNGWTDSQTIYFECAEYAVYSVCGADWTLTPANNNHAKVQFGVSYENFLKAVN